MKSGQAIIFFMARSTMKLISFLFAVFAYQTGIEGKNRK